MRVMEFHIAGVMEMKSAEIIITTVTITVIVIIITAYLKTSYTLPFPDTFSCVRGFVHF